LIRHSGASTRNPDLLDLSADCDEGSNLEFFDQALSTLAETAGRGGFLAIGLVGQRGIPGVVLRRAQAILRWDLRPSLWSHAFVVAEPYGGSDVEALRIREVAMHPRTGRFPEPAENAVGDGWLGLYANATLDANVALINVGLPEELVEPIADRALLHPNLDRLRYDLWTSLGVWETYLWSTGVAPNPLREGYPVPSSAFIEYCYDAGHLDLAPAASERNSAPEHLWNSAVWWSETFAKLERPISGSYVLRDPYCTLLEPDEIPAHGPEPPVGAGP
jgi:hypothetical protein